YYNTCCYGVKPFSSLFLKTTTKGVQSHTFRNFRGGARLTRRFRRVSERKRKSGGKDWFSA
ncbi:MAG: hypothetical protein J6W70_04690, partial [Lentisphaeria bacterium]|nr:hypothetical protein [Lentisphaeria bacterium]